MEITNPDIQSPTSLVPSEALASDTDAEAEDNSPQSDLPKIPDGYFDPFLTTKEIIACGIWSNACNSEANSKESKESVRKCKEHLGYE